MNLLKRYQELCKSPDQLPDLSRFLSSFDADQLPTAEVLAVVKHDQLRQWAAGTRPSVESYLDAFPQLAAKQSDLLELIIHEVQCRQRSGEPAEVEQVVRRFPALAEPLRKALEQSAMAAPFAETSLEFEELCDAFENEFAKGNSPELAQWLRKVSPDKREGLFRALFPVEVWWKRKRNVSVDRLQYARLFPDYKMAIEESWNTDQASPSTHDSDQKHSETSQQATAEPEVESGTRFGSYQLLRTLGEGSFGMVYLAQHELSGDIVAIKMLKSRWARDPDSGDAMRQQFAEEAKTMMRFDHPHVVHVISLNDTADPPYFVQQYIEGETLGKRLQAARPTLEQALHYAIQIADGLAHIHSRERWHRDLKPANILLDRNDHIYLSDFGLALEDAQRWRVGGNVVGTYPYMAPEQIKGATHRLNARCDIWALGVILYEMLTGRRPFRGETREQLCDEILERTPPAPRELNQAIPRALNRLCMQCLAKRDADRPHAAADVREDLLQILSRLSEDSASHAAPSTLKPESSSDSSPSAGSSGSADSSTSPKVTYPVPTLKRFTAEQAELYLRLMPRSYATADELPELITYWKKRIVERDPDRTFSVGIMVGVSGCGKSSMLEAGLVPTLPENVIPILIEASENGTDLGVLNKLRRAIPDADPEKKWSLVDWTFRLRSGNLLPPGHKVVFILDQFEQWLNAHGGEATNPLLDALQQCDAEHLQAIVCVREGFHATLMRFVQALGFRLDEEQNYATAHRFTPDHARFVLTQFGRGLKRLDDPITEEQQAFIDATVAGLAESDRGVVCVRLVILALAMQDRSWTIDELKSLGGLEGIGSQFLVDCFEGRTSSEQYRRYLPAAMRVLAELLPAEGLEIKDVRSYEQLLNASELEKRQFDELLNILVRKLFLLTLVEADRATPETDSGHSPLATRHYQLTHDFLVPSIREWLSINERQTRAGRARLKLAERTAAWRVKHERKQLPTPWETATIYWRTDAGRWTQEQRKMMRTAVKHHSLFWGIATILLLVAGFSLQTWQAQREFAYASDRVRLAAESLQNNLGPSIPINMGELKKLPEILVLDELLQRFSTDNPRRKLALAFALAAYGRPQTQYLLSRMDDIAPTDTGNFVDALSLDREQALAMIKTKAKTCTSEKQWWRKAKLAVAALALGEVSLAADMCQYENRPDPGQRTLFIHEFPQWEWHLTDRALDLSHLANNIAGSQDSGLRSGVCLAVGSISKDRLQDVNADALIAWRRLAARWFAEHGDTSTHSAAHWLLRQWEGPLPEVPDHNQIRADRDWFVNSAGMTMLRIKPPADPMATLAVYERYHHDWIKMWMTLRMSILPISEYWIASCEVTRGQYQVFIEDYDYQHEKPTDYAFEEHTRTTDDYPAHKVSFSDAVMYCNWLSRREGKSPSYRKTAEPQKAESGTANLGQWELVQNASGYRLPQCEEWDYAACAGTATRWSTGSDAQILADYSTMYPSKLFSEAGHKLPNAWGAHDMHGNVFEWCQYYPGDAEGALLGGSWISSAEECSVFHSGGFEGLGYTQSGFRLALRLSEVSGPTEPATTREAEPSGLGTEGVGERVPKLP